MKRNATAEFAGHIEAARIELEAIRQQIEDHLGIDPDHVHWGHVGDAARLSNELKEIADRLLGRGEYAG